VGHADLLGISEPAPVQPRHYEDGANQSVRWREILNMKEVEALAKDLSLVLSLDAEPLSGMHAPEALFERGSNIVDSRGWGDQIPLLHFEASALDAPPLLLRIGPQLAPDKGWLKPHDGSHC
jgi:hypothetical protein